MYIYIIYIYVCIYICIYIHMYIYICIIVCNSSIYNVKLLCQPDPPIPGPVAKVHGFARSRAVPASRTCILQRWWPRALGPCSHRCLGVGVGRAHAGPNLFRTVQPIDPVEPLFVACMTYMSLFRQNMAKSILKAKSSAGQIGSAHTLKQTNTSL